MLKPEKIEDPSEVIFSVKCDCGKSVPPELLNGEDSKEVALWIIDHASHGNIEIEATYLN